MKRAPRTSHTHNEHQTLPLEIYLPLVTSLYKDGRTFLVGTVVVTGAIFVTYWKTGYTSILWCAVAFVLVACVRGLLVRAYANKRPTITSDELAKRWEYRYVAGASASVGLLGIWCYLAFSDSFAHVVSFSMTIAYVSGIFARKLWKHSICHRAGSLCMGTDDGGASVLGNSVRLDLCCPSHPALCRRKIHC
jgi:hypothetical protein